VLRLDRGRGFDLLGPGPPRLIAPLRRLQLDLGFGRTVASEIEAPNILVIPVESG
jgi:hypothetical protein